MMEDTFILGISAFYHDSAVCLLRNGRVHAAAEEERFTRKKHDNGFPEHAVQYCLAYAGIDAQRLDYVAFYDKPILTFERLLLGYLSVAPFGIRSWLKAMPVWLKEKLYIPKIINKKLGVDKEILFTEHHEAHAASAFFPSPFEQAAILTLDGVGEWATTSYGIGNNNKIELMQELHFPDSLGLLYSAFTYFCGFKVNSGEYKLMGLAPYGAPKYKNLIFSQLIDLKADGSFRLNMAYFDFVGGLCMINNRFRKLFGGKERAPESPISQREMDLAASIQVVTEEIVLKMAHTIYKETHMDSLCLAGGVALNCVANGRLLREGPFKEVWVQPASGDSGGALGAALSVWYNHLENRRLACQKSDSALPPYWGPEFSQEEIAAYLTQNNYPYHELDKNGRGDVIARHIAAGKVVGHFAGRMEFGPRALGNRSILGDPRNVDMQRLLNLKIKFRESFRPFAPTVIEEHASDYFELDRPSPFMLFVVYVKPDLCIQTSKSAGLDLTEQLHLKRSAVPAVTHVDYSVRVQTLSRSQNPKYYDLIQAFSRQSGCPMLINTSFNVRGEPIVCNPQDAYRCFMRTQMDILVLEDALLFKEEQPEWKEKCAADGENLD